MLALRSCVTTGGRGIFVRGPPKKQHQPAADRRYKTKVSPKDNALSRDVQRELRRGVAHLANTKEPREPLKNALLDVRNHSSTPLRN